MHLAVDPIQQLVAEGQKDSSGRLSLDLRAIRRTLARVSKLEPGLMLGKLVQAAVVAQARRVRFTLTEREVQARIDFRDPVVQPDLVRQNLAAAFVLAQGLEPLKLSWDCVGEKRREGHGEGPLVLKNTGV